MVKRLQRTQGEVVARRRESRGLLLAGSLLLAWKNDLWLWLVWNSLGRRPLSVGWGMGAPPSLDRGPALRNPKLLFSGLIQKLRSTPGSDPPQFEWRHQSSAGQDEPDCILAATVGILGAGVPHVFFLFGLGPPGDWRRSDRPLCSKAPRGPLAASVQGALAPLPSASGASCQSKKRTARDQRKS